MNSNTARAVLVLSIAAFCWIGAAPSAERAATEESAARTDSIRAALTERVASIFRRSCASAGCHAGAYPKARLSLEPDVMIAAVKDARSRQVDTLMLVDTRAPDRSYLLMKIRGDEPIRGERMPDRGQPLKAEEIRTIERWAESLAAPRKELPVPGSQKTPKVRRAESDTLRNHQN
jgi:hypothetical protein